MEILIPQEGGNKSKRLGSVGNRGTGITLFVFCGFSVQPPGEIFPALKD